MPVHLGVFCNCAKAASPPEHHRDQKLTNKVVAWATEVAGYAAQLPSRQARDDYLRERRGELVIGAQVEGATPRDAAMAIFNSGRMVTVAWSSHCSNLTWVGDTVACGLSAAAFPCKPARRK
jgi:hypothetical protein